jgi:hypothetical protein
VCVCVCHHHHHLDYTSGFAGWIVLCSGPTSSRHEIDSMASTRHSSRYVMRKPRCSLAQAKHRDMRASRVRFGSMCVCVPLSARTRPGLRGLSVHSGHTHCIATLGNRQTPGLFSQRETIRNRAMRALTFRSHHYRSTLAPRGPGCRTRLSGSLWGGLPQWVHGAVSSSKLI